MKISSCSPRSPKSEAEKIQRLYKKALNVHLNFHRPCGFATEVIDEGGKVRKRYGTYLRPFEKFQSLPRPKASSDRGGSWRIGSTSLDLTVIASMPGCCNDFDDSFTWSGIPCARPLGMG